MARSKSFQCSVVTPERVVLECEAQSAVFTAHDGEMGILVDRAPLLAKLGIGSLRVTSQSEEHAYFIDSGFVQMVDNKLTILTEQATPPDDIDGKKAATDLQAALAMTSTDEASHEARAKAIDRARVQVKLSKH